MPKKEIWKDTMNKSVHKMPVNPNKEKSRKAKEVHNDQ